MVNHTSAVPAPTRSRERLLPVWRAALAAAFVLRVVLCITTPGHSYDTAIYARWGAALLDQPWHRFYAGDYGPDHLPGDLYLHALVAWLGGLVGVDPATPGYIVLLKLTAVLIDVGCCALVALLVADVAGRRAAWWAVIAYAWMPPTWLISAVWGQFDNLSIALLLGGLLLLRRRRMVGCGVVAGLLLLIKPQLLLAAVVAALVVGLGLGVGRLRPPGWRARARDLLVTAATAVVTAALVCRPFDVTVLPGLLPGRWSLLERIAYARDLYDNRTLGATNIWNFTVPFWGPDSDRYGPWSAATWGTLGVVACTAAALVVAVGPVVRRRDGGDDLLPALWAAAVALDGWFLLATRNHERYATPVVVLLLVLAARSRWSPALVVAWGLSAAALTGSLCISLWPPTQVVANDRYQQLSVLALIGFAALVAWARPTADGASAAPPAHSPPAPTDQRSPALRPVR